MKRPPAKRTARRGLAAASPADFDGHTAFAQMTPEQRLRWLDDAREFVIAHTAARPAQRHAPLTLLLNHHERSHYPWQPAQ